MIQTLRIVVLGLGWLLAAAPVCAHRVQVRLSFAGMCDASAGVPIGTNLVAVADDENNILRLYLADAGGAPVQALDVSGFLGAVGKFPETDLEGATWLGDKIFWIGSHGRNREGKSRPNRQVFFATKVEQDATGPRLVPEGRCYHDLLLDLLSDSRLSSVNLLVATMRAPKLPGALNIEGLCATSEGHLLIGFRNPIPKGRGLLVPLLNPEQVISGQRARLGDPILLDLGGLGVRDMGLWKDSYYILAGSYNQEKKPRLYTWTGPGQTPIRVRDLDFPKHFTPEALVFMPDRERFLILSDDGTLKTQGIDCKLAPVAQRRFHGAWVEP
jgi:hypothetical protein